MHALWRIFVIRAHLAPELLVDLGISLRAVESLFEPREEHRDNNDCLEGLTEDDEEDGDGEDLGSHVGCWFAGFWVGTGGHEGEAVMGTRMSDKTPLHAHSRSETGRQDGVQLSSGVA